jgi:hypothetical protein
MFQFNLSVLPGDATRDGRVDAFDQLDVRRRLFRSATNPGSGAAAYSVFADVNGSGVIDAADFVFVRQRIASRLPTAPAAVFSAAQILTAMISARREDELARLLS